MTPYEEENGMVDEGYLDRHRYEASLNGVKLTFKGATEVADLILASLPEGFGDTISIKIETENTGITINSEEDFQRLVGQFVELQKPTTLNMFIFANHRKYPRRHAEIYIHFGKHGTRLSVEGTDQVWVLATAQKFKDFLKERNNYKRYALWPVMILTTGLASILGTVLLSLLTHDPSLAGVGFIIGFMVSALIHNVYTLKKFTYNSLDFSDVKNIAQKDDGAVG